MAEFVGESSIRVEGLGELGISGDVASRMEAGVLEDVVDVGASEGRDTTHLYLFLDMA